jgi:hypothetical protein
VVRYNIVPPLFLVVFTGAVQYLALVGQGETNITWRLAASKALGNSFSWACVGLFSLWAILWLQLPSGQVHGPPTLFGYRPPYQVGTIHPVGPYFVPLLFCALRILLVDALYMHDTEGTTLVGYRVLR